jgi:hypothetical protein
MGQRAVEKSDNAGNSNQAGKAKAVSGAARSARSLRVSDTIETSRDFANFMSLLMGDIVSGRIDPRTANAACNAGGKLLRVVELEHKIGRALASSSKRSLQLT